MGVHWSKKSAILVTFALLVVCSTELRAQDTGGSIPGVPQQASPVLTGDQQSAANSALCSAIGSHFPNAASVGPSSLSDPSVVSTAASSFAGSTNLPLPGATDLLKGYVAQHATDIKTPGVGWFAFVSQNALSCTPLGDSIEETES
jgi:hypothetical protein